MSTLNTTGIVAELRGFHNSNNHPQYGQSNAFIIKLQDGMELRSMGKQSFPTGKGADGKATPIGIGSQIMAFYTQNTGKNGTVYNNTKSSQITVMSPGDLSSPPCPPAGGAAQAAPVGAPQQQAGTAPVAAQPAQKASDRYYMGIAKEYAVGRWVNVAAQLVSSGQAVSLEDGVKQAVAIEVETTQKFKALIDEALANRADEQEETKPKKEEKPSFEDDEIPF